jgi:hypothetical protein
VTVAFSGDPAVLIQDDDATNPDDATMTATMQMIAADGNTAGLVGFASSGNLHFHVENRANEGDIVFRTETGGSSGTRMTLKAAGALELEGDLVPSSALSNRNKIINGDMRVSQRAQTYTTATGGGTRYYPVDRFWTGNYTWSAGSDITISQDTASVPTGHKYAYKVAAGGTGLTYASGGSTTIIYSMEAQDIAPYYAETAMTLSFWCRASSTGVYNVLLANEWWGTGTADRGLQKEFSVSVADTWEYKTIEINLAQGTASGTWAIDNGIGLIIAWVLGANANRTGESYLDTWAAWSSYDYATDDNVQLMTNNNATFYLTGVQFEVGSNATPFEHRDFASELARCQRYYFRNTSGSLYGTSCWGIANATTSVVTLMEYPVTMRTGATAIDYSNQVTTNFGATNQAGALTLGSYQSPNRCQIDAGAASGTPFTVGNPYGVRNNNSSTGYIGATAEFLP